ncbi:tagatose kinase [Variovorax rhizosphaerae]|uniref:Sugar kinase n=1 Tax=Variovorax rhizosphaerae TaxID=1836200 RepID=A0ABU8WEH8_9BURK
MGKIMTLGEIVVEIMATQRGQTFLEPGLLAGPFASGAPAIFIDQVAMLGQPAGIIGCVGDDTFGVLNIERLKRDGVDVSAIHVIKQATTGSAFVTYRKDGERDFVFNIANSASSQISPAHVDAQVLKDCKHFHVVGSSLFSFRIIDAMKKAIEIVKGQGGTISFDPNIRKEMLRIAEMREALRYILEFTDIFLPSGNEVTLLANAADEQGAVREILDLGVREVVIKRGARGSSFYDASHHVDVPGFVVEEVDPTGAGDCFAGTFVTRRLQGDASETALRHANASGAMAVSRQGPMEGASDMVSLLAFEESAVAFESSRSSM